MPGWPAGVQRLDVEDLERLGIDSGNQLFWDGSRVEVTRRLDLTGLQKILAAVVAVCAVLGGLGGFMSGLNSGTEFLCARGVTWLSCPVHSPAAR